MTKEERKRSEVIRISQAINAPRDSVFEAWINPEQLSNWLSPWGSKVEFLKTNFSPNGLVHYSLTDGKGQKSYQKSIYREVQRPDRIVYSQYFSDEMESTICNPWTPVWPLEMLATITFKQEGQITTVDVTWTGENATEEECAAVLKHEKGFVDGWTAMLLKQAKYVESLRTAD